MKNFIFKILILIFSFTLISDVHSQDCITFHSDFSGLEWDDAQRTLITNAACELKTIVSDAGFDDFQVHTFGFYGYNPSMEGGTEEVWNRFLSSYLDVTTPHLAIGKEVGLDGKFKKFWISLNYPNQGYFNCLSISDKNALISFLENSVQSGSIHPSPLSMLLSLKSKFDNLKNCCNVQSGTLTCTTCQYNLQEAEAKLLEKGFYKIEASNITITPHVYTNLESSIKISYNVNEDLINLTDEIDAFLLEINGTAKVTTFNGNNCQGLNNFVDLDIHNFDYAEDIVLLDFNGTKAIYTKYTSLCVNNGNRVLPIVIWALRKAGQIAAGVVIDLGLEVLIEKWVGGHSTYTAAFEATEIGCSEVMSAIGDNAFKSKIGEAIWNASKPAVNYVIKTPSSNWSWPGMGTAVQAGIEDALMGQLLGKFGDKFTKSLGRIPAFQSAGRSGGPNITKINLLLTDLKEIVKKNPKFLKELYKEIYKWSMLNARMSAAKKLLRNSKVYDYLEKVKKPTLGWATTNDWGETFKVKNFPEIAADIQAVHHAFPRTLLTKYPTLFKDKAIHSIENLRGIPKLDNFHQEITNSWSTFLKENRSLEEIEEFALKIDDLYGKRYLPPIR